MENNTYSIASLKSTLNEITNACPDIQTIFIFKEDGTIIPAKEGAPEEAAVNTVGALDDILKKAETLGGVQNIMLESDKGAVNVAHMNDFYLVTVAPEGADLKYMNTLAQALVRTVLKLLERINPAMKGTHMSEPEEPTIEPELKPIEVTIEENTEVHGEQATSETSAEKILPVPQVSQFIVDKTEGLFASSDTVRIDNDIISQWAELYEGKIKEVTIETFGGKKVQCKLKPIKGSKHEGKGNIQIPEKIQKSLEIRKGELVRVRPVVE